jgi:hypothetical protein
MEKPFAQARGFFIYFEIGGESPEQGIPMRQKRLERFWTANGGSRRDEPQGWGEQSRSPPGSQLSQKAQSNDWAFLHFTSCKMSFGPASLSKSAPADLCLFALPQAVARVKQEKRDANCFASRLFHALSSAKGWTRRPAVA